MPLALRVVWPALLAGLVAAGFAGMRLQAADWDPVSLAEVGGRYSDLRADDEEGYDGQFVYYVALNPDPTSVGPRLDVPAYRYQRILYPILPGARSGPGKGALDSMDAPPGQPCLPRPGYLGRGAVDPGWRQSSRLCPHLWALGGAGGCRRPGPP